MECVSTPLYETRNDRQYKREEIFYNKLIMFVNETYLVLAVTSFVNLRIITKNYTSAQYF